MDDHELVRLIKRVTDYLAHNTVHAGFDEYDNVEFEYDGKIHRRSFDRNKNYAGFLYDLFRLKCYIEKAEKDKLLARFLGISHEEMHE